MSVCRRWSFCLVKIPVRIFSLPRHLPAKKFFLHFFWLLLAASAIRISSFFYFQLSQPAGKKKHHQQQQEKKKLRSKREEIMFKKLKSFSVWLLSSDKKNTHLLASHCVYVVWAFCVESVSGWRRERGGDEWRIKSYHHGGNDFMLRDEMWKHELTKNRICLVDIHSRRHAERRMKRNSLTTWNLNICFFSMYQNVMTLSLYQTSLLAHAWMEGWNSLLNNPDTRESERKNTTKREEWNLCKKYLLDLKLVATARPCSYAPLSTKPHHQLSLMPRPLSHHSLVAPEQNEQILFPTSSFTTQQQRESVGKYFQRFVIHNGNL